MSTTHTRDEIYWLERGGIAIGTGSETTATVTGPTGDLNVTIYVIKNGDTFVNNDSGGSGQIGYLEEPDIPEEWHEALVNYAVSKGYEMNPQTIQPAGYFMQRYGESVMECKKDKAKLNDDSSYGIFGEQF